MSENKKYFYMKLKDNFFDSEEMKILESMPSGVEYQNLYLKMCLISLKNNGALLFKDIIPYDLMMIATITRIKIDVVKNAIEIFRKIGLVTILDNETIYMSDIQSLVGKSSTEAERIAAYRERTKSVQMYGNSTPELEIELDTEIELKKDIEPVNRKRFTKPTIEEIKLYCSARINRVDPYKFYDYYEANGWKVGKNKMQDWQAAVRTWEKNTNNSPQKPLPVHKQETFLDMPDEKPF